ncbi:hypothetical protein B0H63DRAFT_528651 [Podospora didyma]|uniref:Uncharacterized protein n=1 Tax=Podospora didyma TaxID=330526 RepID=A0AAE0N2Y1_9PEZI|nr:hypothetical protein B0H63DRAFT_528651 [Podospora didyma]
MCDTTFGFGENDAYFVECPSRRCMCSETAATGSNALPPGMVESLNDGDVARGLQIAFAPGGGFMFVFYQPGSRGVRLQTSKLPTALATWLFEEDSTGESQRDFKNLQVSIHATKPDSYWAADGKMFMWKGIPVKLG